MSLGSGTEIAMDLDKEQLEALIEVSRTVNASIDLKSVLNSVMQVTADVMHVEACTLGLLTDDETHVTFEAAVGGKPDAIKGVRVPVGEGIIGWVAKHREPALVNDVAADSRFTGRVDEMTGFRTLSLLCVPVETHQRLLGAVEVLNKTDGAEFTDRDRSFLGAIGVQAASAIDNAQLHQREVELARLAALGEAVAGVAHSVKNILTSVTYGARLIEMALDSHDLDRLARAWPPVHRGTRVLEKLVLDMLAYCKERQPSFGPVDLDELCTAVCDMERARATDRGVEIVVSSSLSDPKVALDAPRIQDTLLNLVANAIDACGDASGKVTVVTDTGDPPDTVSITVSDTGVGMEADQLKDIFKPFYSTKGADGTGLGLSVARKAIEEHGGTIRVESDPGHGTLFTIILPRQH